MKLNRKSGITVTSIVVYIILFFMFTTVTTIISSRFNARLFDDRGNAINITAINKLEYNLLNSASNSYNSELKTDGNKTTITFSNSDIYVFDLDKQIVYKNGGKLVKFLSDFKAVPMDDVIKMSVTLNKYTNKVTRDINVSIPVNTYVENGLIARYDGIDNQGISEHSDVAMTWRDLSDNGVTASLASTFTHDGTTNGWVKDGLLFPATSNTYFVDSIYDTATYQDMTFEITMTTVEQLGSASDSYVYPLYMYKNDGASLALFLGTRYDGALMYGSGNNTVFGSSKVKIEQGNKYTLTFVQNDLTSRTLYFNGEFAISNTGLALSEIEFTRPMISSHAKGSYIVHSVRIYNRALTADEILSNYNTDVLRFGE